jgi:adenylosuccinate lyase
MEHFEDVLATRYAGQQMVDLFSPRQRILIMRDIWIALAEIQMSKGLPVTEAQIAALKATRDNIDMKRIDEIERETKHDVVAHIRAWGEVAGPEAAKIIHLGATSALVTDNADLIQQRRGLELLRIRLVQLIEALVKFAEETKDLTAVGYTHFQAAQPTTMGKRACMWLQDVMMDFNDLDERYRHMQALGAKGATGTSESFLELFKGDSQKTRSFDELFAMKLGFYRSIPIAGQTYTRKIDVQIADALANIGVSLHKMGTDLRLLAHTGEIREEFSAKQVGSSAMPYKRNPMQAERMCALAKLAITYRDAIAHSTAIQWLERTLDDSAMRRVSIPDQFMAVDGALRVATGLVTKMKVDKSIVEMIFQGHEIYFATEAIINKCVERGLNRQVVHEKLRDLADKAFNNVVNEDNEMRIRQFRELVYDEPMFEGFLWVDDLWSKDQSWTGRAKEQAEEYIQYVKNIFLPHYIHFPPFQDAVSK